MLTSEKLIAAKAKIDTPEKWTQGDFSLDKYGQYTQPEGPNAVCYCSLGALYAVGQGTINGTDALKYLAYAVWEIQGFRQGTECVQFTTVHTYNDSHTHEEVMSVFDLAIKKAKEDGQ